MAEPDGGACYVDPERRAADLLAALEAAHRLDGATEPALQRELFERSARELLDWARSSAPVQDPLPKVLRPRCSPRWEGYDIAGWELPSDGIGGDFFDFEDRKAGRLMVAMGDVSGHGQAPALVAAACLAPLRATLLDTDEPGRSSPDSTGCSARNSSMTGS